MTQFYCIRVIAGVVAQQACVLTFSMVFCVREQKMVKKAMLRYLCFSSALRQRTDAHMTGVSYQVGDSELAQAQNVQNVILIHE